MKKKFLFLSALVAATTAFIGCSSDENLAEVPVVVEEDTPAVDTPKGTPFSVVVNNEDGTTRATLLDGSSLGTFKLYGIHPDNEVGTWIDGNVFKLSSTWEPYDTDGSAKVTGLTWPTGDAAQTATQFYAVSDNNAAGITIGTSTGTSAITENNLASGNFKYKFQVDETSHSLPIVDSPSGEDDYMSVNNVVNFSKQSDLLVASTSQTEGTNGQLSLQFRHALASLAIRARFTESEDGEDTGVPANSTFTIYWIRIHGLKGSGTFAFPETDDYNATTHRWGTSPWSAPSSDVIYEVDFTSSPIVITSQAKGSSEALIYTPLVSHTEMMVIPQTFTPWAGYDANAEQEKSTPASGCYIEIDGKWTYVNNKGKTQTVMRRNATVGTCFLPLKITNNELLIGVKHTITLNLNLVMYGNGALINSASEGAGS